MGYVMLFSAAFPLAPVLATLSTAIELRTHALKLLHGHQRPFAECIDDILTWDEVLGCLSFLAVVTNCAVLACTSRALEHEFFGTLGATTTNRFFLAIGLEHAIFLLRKLFDFAVPKMPLRLKKQQLEIEVERLRTIYQDGIEEGTKRAVRHRKLSRNLERMVSRDNSSNYEKGSDDDEPSDCEDAMPATPPPPHVSRGRAMSRRRSGMSKLRSGANKSCSVM